MSSENSRIHVANVMHPYIVELKQFYDSSIISDYDFVAIVILLYLSIDKPQRWLSGKLTKSIVNKGDIVSIKIKDLSESIKETLNINYLKTKFSSLINDFDEEATIIDVFNSFKFYGIKKNKDDYINKSIVYWSIGKRNFDLMFSIPSPLQVLKQQADKRRVITLFVNYEDLINSHVAMLYYMDGSENYTRNSLEFTLHDLKHMELFFDPEICSEQFGFFRCFVNLGISKVIEKLQNAFDVLMTFDIAEMLAKSSTAFGVIEFIIQRHPSILEIIKDIYMYGDYSTSCCLKSTSPKIVFKDIMKLDETFWRELEYVISDMNCYSTHLIRYLFAKLMLAVERQSNYDGSQSEIKNNLCRYWILILMGMGTVHVENLRDNLDHASRSLVNCQICIGAFEAGMSMLNAASRHSHSMTACEGEQLRRYFQFRSE